MTTSSNYTLLRPMGTDSFVRSGFKVNIEKFNSQKLYVLSYIYLGLTIKGLHFESQLKLYLRNQPGWIGYYLRLPCAALFTTETDAIEALEKCVLKGIHRREFQIFPIDK